LLLGRHLLAMGLEPGPRVGQIIRQVYERQLDGAVQTEEQALAAARVILGKRDQ
jgi:tRNA nucleotidyltransferase (CCA-adding enzyme)